MRATEIALWALRKRRPFRVRGPSMEPDFLDGDLVLIDPSTESLAPGDVVVARHPFKNLDVIKYLDSIDDDGLASLRSPAGDDSRRFGRIPLASIRGRVTANLSRRAF